MNNIRAELKYTKDHEWIRQDDDGSITVGITDYAQGELGDLVYFDIETQGETLDAGDEFGSVEAVKTVAELYMPVSGEILEFNPALAETPEIVNSSPYDDGWIVRIQPNTPAELGELLDSEQYKNILSGD